jgi:hypothetical protein
MTHPIGTRLRARSGVRRPVIVGDVYEVVSHEDIYHRLIHLPDRTPVDGAWSCLLGQYWDLVEDTAYLRVYISKDNGRLSPSTPKYTSVQSALTGIDADTRAAWDVYAVPLRAVAKLRDDGTIEEFN